MRGIKTSKGTAIARVGYALNLAGIAIGAGAGGFIAIAVSPLGEGWQLALGATGFLSCYAVGRGARYLLTGR